MEKYGGSPTWMKKKSAEKPDLWGRVSTIVSCRFSHKPSERKGTASEKCGDTSSGRTQRRWV
jgi:hypothetical protein